MQVAKFVVVQRGHDEQSCVGSGGTGFVELIRLDHEIFANQRHVYGGAHLAQMIERALKEMIIGEHADARCAIGLVIAGKLCWVEHAFDQQAFRRRCSFDLGDEGDAAIGTVQGGGEIFGGHGARFGLAAHGCQRHSMFAGRHFDGALVVEDGVEDGHGKFAIGYLQVANGMCQLQTANSQWSFANGNIARHIVIDAETSSSLFSSIEPIVLDGCKRIGVLADTHIPHRMKEMPPRVYELLRGCDVILHAGDLESTEILEPLRAIAPTYAVRGNLHWQFSTGTHDQDLPVTLTFRVGKQVIWMTHGHMRFAYSVVDKVMGIGEKRSLSRVNKALIARLQRLKPKDATVVIFGHSHLSCAANIDDVLYFNPGAVTSSATQKSKEQPRVGFLNVGDDGAIAYEWREL